MTIYISELLNISGSVSVGGNGGLTWKVVSVNTNTEAGSGYIVNTTSGEITLTFPETPVVGDLIGVSDYNNSFATNHCVISRNGNNIMGLSENFVCDIDSMSLMFVFVDATQGWKILYGI